MCVCVCVCVCVCTRVCVCVCVCVCVSLTFGTGPLSLSFSLTPDAPVSLFSPTLNSLICDTVAPTNSVSDCFIPNPCCMLDPAPSSWLVSPCMLSPCCAAVLPLAAVCVVTYLLDCVLVSSLLVCDIGLLAWLACVLVSVLLVFVGRVADAVGGVVGAVVGAVVSVASVSLWWLVCCVWRLYQAREVTGGSQGGKSVSSSAQAFVITHTHAHTHTHTHSIMLVVAREHTEPLLLCCQVYGSPACVCVRVCVCVCVTETLMPRAATSLCAPDMCGACCVCAFLRMQAKSHLQVCASPERDALLYC